MRVDCQLSLKFEPVQSHWELTRVHESRWKLAVKCERELQLSSTLILVWPGLKYNYRVRLLNGYLLENCDFYILQRLRTSWDLRLYQLKCVAIVFGEQERKHQNVLPELSHTAIYIYIYIYIYIPIQRTIKPDLCWKFAPYEYTFSFAFQVPDKWYTSLKSCL
jgi:hypothetical protein